MGLIPETSVISRRSFCLQNNNQYDLCRFYPAGRIIAILWNYPLYATRLPVCCTLGAAKTGRPLNADF